MVLLLPMVDLLSRIIDSDDDTNSLGQQGGFRVLKPIEKRHLFSNVLCVCLSSGAFMRDLENRWLQSAPYLNEICDLIVAHASSKNFEPYIIYLRNQTYQMNTLRKLNEREAFRQTLTRLHNNTAAGKNHLDSFLALPMQRLTRLKLLVEVIQKLQKAVIADHEKAQADATKATKAPRRCVTVREQRNAEQALKALKTLLAASETEKRLMDHKARLLEIANSTDFPESVKSIAISGRILLKEGELKCLRDEQKSSVFKMLNAKRTVPYYLILFDDLLVVTKPKNGRYKVIDYCPRKAIEATAASCDAQPDKSSPEEPGTPTSTRFRSKAVTRTQSSRSMKTKLNSPDGQEPSTPSPIKSNLLELHLQNSHNGSCTDLKFLTTNQLEMNAWLEAFSLTETTSQ